jgi:outer membrane receptor protein involved in Fe transport
VDALRYVQSWDWQSGVYRFSVKPYLRRSEMDFTQHFVFPEALEKNGHNSGGVQGLVSRDDFGWGSWKAGAEGEWANAWTKEWQEKPSTPSSPQGVHYDYDVGMQTAALWQELTLHLSDSLDTQVGVRADRVLYDYNNRTVNGASGKFMRPDDRNDGFSLLSPRVGLIYTDRFDDEWYASASTANRAPQTAELYRLQGAQKSADIGEEVADGGEIGWRGSLEQGGATTQWNVTLFDMHKDHVIIRNPTSVLSDDAQTQHRGVEISVQQDWASGWFAAVAATYAEHRYNSDVFDRSVSIDGNMIDTAPRTLGSVQAGWQQSAMRIELEWQHVGSYYLNPEDTFAYEGHNLLNLRGQYRVANDWTVFARLMNLTGQEYAERADVTAFPVVEPRYFVGQPRSLYLGFEWSY